jgi:hypothetical protein
VVRSTIRYREQMARRPVAAAEIEKVRRQSLLAGAQAVGRDSSELLRWTLGSLLVVNGGAIVALLGAEDLRTEAFKEAVFWFAGGMLAALIGGLGLTVAHGLRSADRLLRAWDPTPLVETDLTNLKTARATHWWTGVSLFLWFTSLALFGVGCISTAFVPEASELRRLGVESREATVRSAVEVANLLEVLRNPNSTLEQRLQARARFRAASAEAIIRSARVGRALGETDNLIDYSNGLLNASSN